MNTATRLLDDLDPDTLTDEAAEKLLDSMDHNLLQQWAVAAVARATMALAVASRAFFLAQP